MLNYKDPEIRKSARPEFLNYRMEITLLKRR